MGSLLLAGLLVVVQDPGRVAGWRSDLALLLTEARRVHASPSRPAHRPEFEDMVRRLSDQIPNLSDERMVIEVQRLLALLGDGHSLVYLNPTPQIPLSRLPVDLYWFADGIFVIGGTGEGERLIGTRIVRIGKQPVERLQQRLESYISRDNAMGLKRFGSFYLTIPGFLHALGVAESGQPVSMTLADSRGNTRTVTLAAGSWRPPRRKLAAPAGAAEPVPLYLQRGE